MTLEKNANHIWVTPEGRTSFLFVYTARPNTKRKGAMGFEFTLLFDKHDPAPPQLRQIAANLTSRVFGKTMSPRPIFPGDPYFGTMDKPVFKDGDVMYAHKPDTYESYAGKWVLSLWTPQNKPIEVQDQDRQPVLKQDIFQSGDYGFAAIEVSVYTSPEHGPQLSVKPKVIRKTRDGEHFESGGVSTAAAVAAMDGVAPATTPQTTPPAKKPLL